MATFAEDIAALRRQFVDGLLDEPRNDGEQLSCAELEIFYGARREYLRIAAGHGVVVDNSAIWESLFDEIVQRIKENRRGSEVCEMGTTAPKQPLVN